jgi:hypothetical protein
MIDTPQAQETLAELAESTAAALLAFAQAVRPASDRDGDDLASLGLGRRQLEIAALAGLDTDEGLSTSEVAREIDYDAANTHAALYALAARGVAEGFRHGEHTRWRLTPRYRSANPYLAIAQLITAGEWTTFDDISLVVHGDLRHGREVVRAAVELPDFPAHRVLPPGGQVPAAWRSFASKTADPGECVRLLAGEGVPVDGSGRASRARYIGWDQLAERACDAGRLG